MALIYISYHSIRDGMSLIPQSINSTEIVTWGVDNVMSGVIIGFILLMIGIGLISPCRICINKLIDRRDRKRIYDWLYNETEKYSQFKIGIVDRGTLGTRTDPTWCRTEDIASCNEFTIHRTRELCYTHHKIVLMTTEDIRFDKKNTTEYLEEKWAIKEFVR